MLSLKKDSDYSLANNNLKTLHGYCNNNSDDEGASNDDISDFDQETNNALDCNSNKMINNKISKYCFNNDSNDDSDDDLGNLQDTGQVNHLNNNLSNTPSIYSDDESYFDEEIAFDNSESILMDFQKNPYLSEFKTNLLEEDIHIPDIGRPTRFQENTPSFQENTSGFQENTSGFHISKELISLDNINSKSTISKPLKKSNQIKSINSSAHSPTKLRISTMTAISNINIVLKLDDLYKYITFLASEEEESSASYIKSCQCANEPIKGYATNQKTKRTKSKNPNKNCFQNQATLIIAISKDRQINLKIFRNGKIQMTGLKSEEEGYIASNTLISKINEIYNKCPTFITSPNKNPYISDLSIVLINSDFSAGFRIKRERLYELLFKSGMYVSYEPDIYPGVNAKYYWNCSNKEDDGICKCSKLCDGKGGGNGDGDCKKITIATFQSGNVIITGARQNIQTQDAYKYINKLFSENMSSIIRTASMEDENIVSKKPKMNTQYNISIKDIKNFNLKEKLKMLN